MNRVVHAHIKSPTVYCVTRDETIQARDAKTGKLQQSVRWQDKDDVRGIAISPGGSMLATAGHRGKIKHWQSAGAASSKCLPQVLDWWIAHRMSC